MDPDFKTCERVLKVLVYSAEESDAAQRLSEAVMSAAHEHTVFYPGSLRDLIGCFRGEGPTPDIVVLLANNTDELIRLLSASKWLEGTRVILVLPDSSQVTISLAYHLKPRFIDYVDRNFEGVAAVLSRMLQGARVTEAGSTGLQRRSRTTG